MDEFTRKSLESAAKYAGIMDSLKPTTATQMLLDELNMSMARMPNFSIPTMDIRPPRIPTQAEVNNYQSASVLMKALAEEALKWKEELPPNYSPAILAVLHGGIQLHVQTLSQVSFHGIRITGTLNGSPCSLLAHQSTVQMLCYGEEINTDTPRLPIGFIWDNNKVEV